MLSVDIVTGETVFTNYSVSPLHLIGRPLFIASEEILEKMKLIFIGGASKDNSDLCVINDDGQVYLDLPEPDQDGFVIKDGVLIGYTGNDATVVIPEGVTTIRSEAFTSKNMYQIVLPSTLIQIEDYAFVGCHKLVAVINKSQLDIKCGTTDFGSVALNAFSVSPEEGTITLVDEKFVFYLGETNYLVSYIGNDATVVLPQTEYEYIINQYAFSDNDAIKHIDFGTKVVAIGKCAFDGCELLESINIPASVKQIGEYAFRLCIQLKEVVFADNSMLTSIDPGAFTSCEELTSITIPKGVTTISRDVFINCRNLTSVTIQSSVTNIDMQAFHNCIDLTTVYYTGTEEQWNNIVIGENNEYLLNANIVFNYTGEEK